LVRSPYYFGSYYELVEEIAMKAAVVTAFDTAPRYLDASEPVAGPGQQVATVLAAGLHPRVRSQANGSHYTSAGVLPLIPGVDAVVRDEDGGLHYLVLPGDGQGSMAERVVLDPRRSVRLPDDCDPVAVAAGMNPAMSAWVPLRRRIPFQPGQSVLVLGATGSAGRMAVQVAADLGAGRVTAVARDTAALATLDVDATVDLADDEALAAAGSTADVVLDYLWGEPTARALRAIVPARVDDARPLHWVQIGSVAGPTPPIPSAALRATALTLVGSGQGSVSPREILAELPEIARRISAGRLRITARAVPLSEVESAWTTPSTADRIVLVP